jgi:hypothetical protein
MKEQVRQRIESLERELQGLKDELQPEVKVGSWYQWLLPHKIKVRVIRIDSGDVYYSYSDKPYEFTYDIKGFLKDLTPCEAPKPEIEVGSWWFGNQSEEKVQVTKIDKKRVHYTYEDGCEGALKFHNFTNRFTPCEAPAKETWYLCTEDLGANKFKRGEEYKMSSKNPLSLIDEEGFPHKLIGWAKYFVNPQER